MLETAFVLILWYGSRPDYFGQYASNRQCQQVVEKILEQGIGSDEGVKFQCVKVTK